MNAGKQRGMLENREEHRKAEGCKKAEKNVLKHADEGNQTGLCKSRVGRLKAERDAAKQRGSQESRECECVKANGDVGRQRWVL